MTFVRTFRRMQWANLKRSMNQLRTLSFVRSGRDSGYPPCCITYYIIRAICMEIWGIIFGNYGWFIDEKRYYGRGFATHEDYLVWMKGKPQHVLCWLHKLLYRGKTMEYHKCPKCDWEQFRIKECRRC